jgi:hypothetical protein
MSIQKQTERKGRSSHKQSTTGGTRLQSTRGIDYNETFAPVARLESIRLLVSFTVSHSIKLYQMDVKSALFNGYISEEVYVNQPPGFENTKCL